MSSDVDVLACPFCGGMDISDGEVSTSYPNGKQTVQSMCNDCKALGAEFALADGEIDYGSLKAITAWNTRVALAAPHQTGQALTDNQLFRMASQIRELTWAGVHYPDLLKSLRDIQAENSPTAAPVPNDEEIGEWFADWFGKFPHDHEQSFTDERIKEAARALLAKVLP